MKILGLNTDFDYLEYDGFVESRFSSSISLLDYDAVIIDTNLLIDNSYSSSEQPFQNKTLLSDYASHQIEEDFPKIRDQLVELLKLGRNVYLLMGNNDNCYVYTGEKTVSGTGKNAQKTRIVKRFDAYSFLPVHISATHVFGRETSICCNAPYYYFLKNTIDCSHYGAYFSIEEPHEVLARINGTDKVIAAVIPYANGKIICLPQPFYEDPFDDPECNPDDWAEYGNLYLDSLFELNKQLSISDQDFSLPTWATEICILGEKEELAKQECIEKEIETLQISLEEQKQRIQEIQKYKLLLTASGGLLEEETKRVLDELGFTILEAEKGRSDIIAKYGDIGIVAEIKGVSKSAAEKHAAQLEKWASLYLEENGNIPKALLIVNGFCNTPVAERTEEVFPHQMLPYCEARRHILITTAQLLCLYIEVQRDPACKEDRIIELLSTVGKYERYQDISAYLN